MDNRYIIENELTEEALISAKKIVNELFKMHKDFAYSISIDEKSYMYFADTEEQLERQLKIMLHNKHGIIIIYVVHEDKKYSFGFSVDKTTLIEIPKEIILKHNKDTTVFATTMQNFLKEIKNER